MNCSEPIDAAVLVDYWLAALPAAQEETVEEHLLACDSCGDRLREVIVLADGIRNLAREGSLRMIVSDALLDRARDEGLHIREYSPPRGGSVQCTVTSQDDLLIARLAADISGAKQVDLSLCDASGIERRRMSDIPIRPDSGSVIYQESITFAKDLGNATMIARMFAIDAPGVERLLGEYTFHHTRSLPGPGLQESLLS